MAKDLEVRITATETLQYQRLVQFLAAVEVIAASRNDRQLMALVDECLADLAVLLS